MIVVNASFSFASGVLHIGYNAYICTALQNREHHFDFRRCLRACGRLVDRPCARHQRFAG